ncbi:MAG: Macrolide export protein MacA [bacterium ADurb.Bin243]|nr:MAG: Macrolide export protein MacA [bacterium ADurb.Bin243]HOD40106.1 efflux RND transporter periplasmic adaptor subunit [Candidatus Wallbacteria bacterium]
MKRRFNNLAYLKLAAILAALVPFALIFACSQVSVTNGNGYYTLEPGELKTYLELHGVIESREKAEISALHSGIIEYLKPEGDYVKKGELIAKLETTELKDMLEDLVLNKRMIDIDSLVKEDEHEQKVIEKRNRSLYEAINMDKNKVIYRQLKYGLDYDRKIELEYELANAQIEIKNLEGELGEKEILKSRGFISQAEINDLKQQIFSKKKSCEAVALNLEKLLRGADIKQLAEKETEIKSDSLSVELTQKAYEVSFSTRAAIKKGLKNRLSNINKSISRLQTIIDAVSIKAPIDGIVIYGKTWITEGEREKVKIGINVWQGWSFMSVASLNAMDVHFRVNEVDISRVKIGQAVEFSLTSDPGKILKAEIYDIANVAAVSESDANGVCNILVKAKIEGDAKNLDLKPGVSVNARILTGVKKDALFIPRAALINGDSVMTAAGELKKVATGVYDLFNIEVISGLARGDKITASGETARRERTLSEFHTASRGGIADFIKEMGELAPSNKTNVSVAFSGKINKIVPEGTFVEKGYEIALIDVKEREDKLKEKQLREKVLNKEKKIIEERAAADIRAIENNIKIKKIDLEILQLDYEILIMPLKKQKRKEFEISIKLCENSLKGTENEFELKKEMAKKGYISANEINKIKVSLNKARAALDVARYRYDYEKSLPLPSQVAKSKMELQKAKLDFELEQFKLSKRRQKLGYDLEKKGIEIRSNNYSLKEIKKIVEGANVKAPISGTAVYVKKWSSEGMKKIKEGDITRENMTFLELANLDSFYIKASVPEEYFNKIRVGQPVTFYLPSAPDKKYQGKIKSIGLFAREREESDMFSFNRGEAVTEAPKYFDIEIETGEKNPKFQPGISVNFEIPLESKAGVIVIDRKFLFKDREGDFVYLKNGVKQRVKCGIKSLEDVEITEGLKEGDVIAY